MSIWLQLQNLLPDIPDSIKSKVESLRTKFEPINEVNLRGQQSSVGFKGEKGSHLKY